MNLRIMFTKRWIVTTVLVLLGTALCIRLGIWQLDRLDQRKAFNAHVEAMWAEPVLDLNTEMGANLVEMEYRSVQVEGVYDYQNQAALRNQYWNNQYGYHLLTPMVLSDGAAVLIDRGWIPAEGNDAPADWRKYDQGETATIAGVIRLGQENPDVGGVPDKEPGGEGRLDFWNNVNLERISEQLPYDLMGVYIQPDVDAADTQPPIAYQPEIELSEGPHLGYAGQWFTFATILFVGYPFYLKKREQSDESKIL